MLCCCGQLACAIRELVKLAGGPDKPHFICGDFNSWPDSPPYQLVQDGHLSEKSLTALQSINSVSQADGQVGWFSIKVSVTSVGIIISLLVDVWHLIKVGIIAAPTFKLHYI